MANKKLKTPLKLVSASILASLLLTGCFNDSDNDNISTPPSVEQNMGSITGTVVDQISLNPIAGATITINNQEYTTDANGEFTLSGLPVNEDVTLTINANNYPERTFSTRVANSTTMEVEYQLNNDSTVTAVTQSVTENISLSIANLGAQLDIPANALQRADGQPIVGEITVMMDVITPSVDSEEMPGGYGIVDGGFMESFGALNVTATDSEGNPLVLTDGNNMTMMIPLSTRNLDAIAAQMPLFFYNELLEDWVQTGTASLQTSADGTQIYAAEVDEIGAWNVDLEMSTVNVLGCVEDTDGNRVSNAWVKGDGINYSSVTTALTDNNGNFTLPVRDNGDLYIYAENGNRTSNAKSVSTSGNDYQMNDGCLTVSTENDSLSIRLTWGEQPHDVDSYLRTPSGDVIFFGNQASLSQAPFAALDVDDTESFGPEFVTVRKLMVGRYSYGVDNYSETQNPGLKDSPISVLLEGPTIRSRTLTPTLNDKNLESIFWHSFDLVVDANCNITYKSVDSWLSESELLNTFGDSTSVEPTYCVAP